LRKRLEALLAAHARPNELPGLPPESARPTIRVEDTKQVVARLEAERQALAMMDHPNIGKVLDAGAIDALGSEISNLKSQISLNRPFFVVELVRGLERQWGRI